MQSYDDYVEENYISDFEETEYNWLCPVCGHFEESAWHCSKCNCQPPWGCQCALCEEKYWPGDYDIYLSEVYFTDDKFVDYFEDYQETE